MSLIKNSLVKALTHEARVVEKSAINEKIFRLVLNSDFFKKYPFKPGEYLHILLQSNKQGGSTLLNRSYSVWQQEQTRGEVTLAIAHFTEGPGAQWIRSLQQGQHLRFTGPVSGFNLISGASQHIMVGDVCALGHFYHLQQGLNQQQNIQLMIYGDDQRLCF